MKLECGPGKGVWLQNGLTMIFGNTQKELNENEAQGFLLILPTGEPIVGPGENPCKFRQPLHVLMESILDTMDKLHILTSLGNGNISFKAPPGYHFILNDQGTICFFWEKGPAGNTPELFRAALRGICKGLIKRENGQQNGNYPESGQQKSPGIPVDPSKQPQERFSGNEWEIGPLLDEEAAEKQGAGEGEGLQGNGNEK